MVIRWLHRPSMQSLRRFRRANVAKIWKIHFEIFDVMHAHFSAVFKNETSALIFTSNDELTLVKLKVLECS